MFLSLANIKPAKTTLKPLAGKSVLPVFYSEKEGVVNAENDHVIFGKERHDVGRPHEWGYPIRGIIKDGFYT